MNDPTPALDSEPWRCAACGAQLIGRRGDLCRDCGVGTGPYQDDQTASAASTWARSGRPGGSMTECNLDDLVSACGAAGVTLGQHDQAVVRWLASFEPSTAAVVVGLIARAHSAGWESARAFGEH